LHGRSLHVFRQGPGGLGSPSEGCLLLRVLAAAAGNKRGKGTVVVPLYTELTCLERGSVQTGKGDGY